LAQGIRQRSNWDRKIFSAYLRIRTRTVHSFSYVKTHSMRVTACVYASLFAVVVNVMSAVEPVCNDNSNNCVPEEDDVSLIQVTRGHNMEKGQIADPPWNGEKVTDLHEQYDKIFKTGNRNAASHLWSSFLLDKSKQMTHEKLTYMFGGFCAVSGSPVEPEEFSRYRVTLEKVGGGKQTGFMYHCCWPCHCDTMDFVKVDTKSYTTKDGKARQYNFLVVGNPCKKPEDLKKKVKGSQGTLEQEAPELKCEDGQLKGAHVSDNGHIIISMFLEDDQSLKSIDPGKEGLEQQCTDRAQIGYQSGMGMIFRQMAGIVPL